MGIGWFAFLIVGLLAGWIAEKIMKRDHGIFTNLIVGVIGAYLGAWIGSMIGVGANGFWSALIIAVAGAVLLLWIVGLVRSKA
ncbi:GlsB/YeaQ/YmgE family stress response membrane protein [Sulfitobacter sp. LCG007]